MGASSNPSFPFFYPDFCIIYAEFYIKLILDLIHESVPSEDLSDVHPDIPLRDQLELDSVDFLNIIMELQMRYGIEIPEDDFIELTTLNRCVANLGPKLEAGA